MWMVENAEDDGIAGFKYYVERLVAAITVT
jgi:hypothetical protein